MKTWLKDIFSFSKHDRNGILILIILISTGFIFKYIQINNKVNPNYKNSENTINEFNDSLKALNQISKTKYLTNNKKKFKYNFKEKTTRIKPKSTVITKSKSNHFNLTIELNAADTSELIKIKGIGKILSKRIIKYKQLLGGYYGIGQLNDVYGISDSVYHNIKSNFIIDSSYIKTINLNQSNEFQLKRHPYISNYEAKAIISYKNYKKNKINNINELKINKIIPDTTYFRIRHYLSVK